MWPGLRQASSGSGCRLRRFLIVCLTRPSATSPSRGLFRTHRLISLGAYTVRVPHSIHLDPSLASTSRRVSSWRCAPHWDISTSWLLFRAAVPHFLAARAAARHSESREAPYLHCRACTFPQLTSTSRSRTLVRRASAALAAAVLTSNSSFLCLRVPTTPAFCLSLGREPLSARRSLIYTLWLLFTMSTLSLPCIFLNSLPPLRSRFPCHVHLVRGKSTRLRSTLTNYTVPPAQGLCPFTSPLPFCLLCEPRVACC